MRENWNSIAKHLTKEKLDQSDETAIEEMENNTELKNIYDETADALKKVDLYFNLKKIDTDTAWKRLDVQMQKSNKVIGFRIRLVQVAAVALLLIAAGFATWKVSQSRYNYTAETALNDLSHPEVLLPDGSKVSLNYGSKLIYPKVFKGKQRMVKLTGEAFFEVTPNASQPFIIQTKGASVKVLGTSFNVQAYDGDERIEVYVKTGKVELISSDTQLAMSNKVLLLPGEKGTFDTNTKSLIKELANQVNDLAWLTHNIEFKSTELNEVIHTLEHVYRLKIDIDKNVDLNMKFTSTFNQHNPDYILEVVAIALDLHLTKIDKNSYLIKK